MAFEISGYVLEPIRVGQANSPFTQTPDNLISNQVAFDAAYPSSEANPRTDYLVLVTSEGEPPLIPGTPPPYPGALYGAEFGWVKNEIVQRFDYAARSGRFKPLPGAAITVVGNLAANSNTARLKVRAPVQAAVVPAAPYRLSVGATGSGVAWAVTIVALDVDFGSPPSLTAELSLETGNLNWHAADLTTYAGQLVRFQQQQFFDFQESTGNVGYAPVSLTDPLILLNPKPGTGQFPLLRFGFGFYLQTIEVPNDAGLVPAPASGFVKWSLATGRLAFNAGDAATYAGTPVYYDGVLFATGLQLPRQVLGDIATPAAIVGLPPVGVDLIFSLPAASTYYQFPRFKYLPSASFSPSGKVGEVQVDPLTGVVQFSASDQSTYAPEDVTVVFGDLPIERGISVRLLRTPVNLDGSQALKDVTAIYEVKGATWADPIIGSPQVFLPSTPIQDAGYQLKVQVFQGQGTFTSNDFPDLSLVVAGTSTTFTGPTLTDPLASFSTAGVTTGSLLQIHTTVAKGLYTVVTVTPTTLTTNPPAPSAVVGATYSIYPASNLGYYIDFDAGTLFYAQRKNLTIVPITQRTSDVMLPDPLVLQGNLLLELETGPGTGIYNPLVLGTDALFDSTSGVVSLTTNAGQIVAQGTSASFSGTAFSDLTADFIAAGVQPGYLIEIDTTAAKGVYTVQTVVSATALTTDVPSPSPVMGAQYSVRVNREVLADRYFDEVQLVDPSTKVERIRGLGPASNGPRLNIPIAYVNSSGFRLGPASGGQFATVVVVPNNGAFTAPPTGTVQVSAASGDLNFAAADLGTTVYWAKTLVPDVDYIMSPGLGLIQFTDRMLTQEEVLITYTTQPPSTDPPTPAGPPVTEYARFLIRKEITQAHPTPTSTLTFNVASPGRPVLPVASNPPPAVFRGGRPQTLGTQCVVDTVASTITFLADSIITDALPHGAIIGPSERVYIDYYVTQAVGGEKTTTILNPPIQTATVNIQETDQNGNPNNKFTITGGDYTASFPTGYLLRIEKDQVYLIGSSVYAPDTTTVTLAGTQVFQDTFNDPKLYVSSGPTPITSAPLVPAYFTPETQAFEAIARGSNTLLIAGDRTLSYRTGVVLLFTNGGSTFTDFLQVSGASYDPDTDRTKVMLSANALRQYVQGTQILLYSVRPVFEPPTVEVPTSQVPVLTQPTVVYRRVTGQPGVILDSPTDYKIDDTGRVVFTTALAPLEEFSIFYTGLRVVSPGINLRASYTSQIAPNANNGLLGQVLLADYFIQSPDTFYYRVETMTNFRGEYAKEIESEASSGSSGPQTSNASQPQLFEQGRKSLYFDEGHLANQDIIARSSLLFYNNSVNLLEAYLRALDGRVVGNNDGLFLFDGTTGILNPSGSATFPLVTTLQDLSAIFTTVLIGRTVEVLSGANKSLKRTITAVPSGTQLTLSPALPSTSSGKYRVLATNQIDDVIQVSPAPYSIKFPPLVVTSIGTFRKYYIPGALSRFYPTSKDFFAFSTVTSDSETGDEVVDTKSTNVTLVAELHTRLAWGVLTESTEFSGPSILKVDFADGSEPGFDDQVEKYARPPFKNGMKCVVQRRDGTFINPATSPVTVTAVAANQLTVTGLASVADVGTTVYRSPIDDSVQVDPDKLTYYTLGLDYSFNGDSGQVIYIGAFPPPLVNTQLVEAQALSGKVNLINTLTAPLQFPALYGGIEDDDGDLSFPIQTPDPDSEQQGYLFTEDKLIHAVTGLIRTVTTSPFVGTGSLNAPRTIITNAVPFVAPLPKVHDLVRILSGLNGQTTFRRITAVGASTVTVSEVFAVVDAGFTFEIGVSALAVTGTAAVTSTVTQLDDLLATFLTSAKVGQTVVLTSGANNGERRQISAIASNTSLTMTPALPFLPAGQAYRIDNSLATYGGTSGDHMTELSAALAGEILLYPDEQQYIEDFLDQVFTDVTTGTGSTSAAVLTDGSATFLDDGVSPVNYVYIETGLNAGIYPVLSVTQTQITVTTPFPVVAAGVAYRVVSLFGASEASIQALFALHQNIAALISSATAFQTLISTPVAVTRTPADTASFARATLTTDLGTRDMVVDARIAALPTDILTVENILANTDRLYDTRWTWVDARINLESGLTVQQATATANRVKDQANIYKQLIKLLAVEGS